MHAAHTLERRQFLPEEEVECKQALQDTCPASGDVKNQAHFR